MSFLLTVLLFEAHAFDAGETDLVFVRSWIEHAELWSSDLNEQSELENELYEYIINRSESILIEQGIKYSHVFINDEYRAIVKGKVKTSVASLKSFTGVELSLKASYVLEELASEVAIQSMLSKFLGFDSIRIAETTQKPRLEKQVFAKNSEEGLQINIQPKPIIQVSEEHEENYEVVNMINDFSFSFATDIGGFGSGNGLIERGEWISFDVNVENNSNNWWFSSSIWFESKSNCIWLPKSHEIELAELGPVIDESIILNQTDETDSVSQIQVSQTNKSSVLVPLRFYVSNSCPLDDLLSIQYTIKDTYRTQNTPLKGQIDIQVSDFNRGELKNLTVDSDYPGASKGERFESLEESDSIEMFSEYKADPSSISAEMSFLIEAHAKKIFDSISNVGFDAKNGEVEDYRQLLSIGELKDDLKGLPNLAEDIKIGTIVLLNEDSSVEVIEKTTENPESKIEDPKDSQSSSQSKRRKGSQKGKSIESVEVAVLPPAPTHVLFTPQDDLDLMTITNPEQFQDHVRRLASHWKWSDLDHARLLWAVDVKVKYLSPDNYKPFQKIEPKEEPLEIIDDRVTPAANVDDIINLLPDYLSISAHHIEGNDGQSMPYEKKVIKIKDDGETETTEYGFRGLKTVDAIDATKFELDFDQDGFKTAYSNLIKLPPIEQSPPKEAVEKEKPSDLELEYVYRHYFTVPVKWVLREETRSECTDRIDNDLDGLVDCEETKCQEYSVCQPKERFLVNDLSYSSSRVAINNLTTPAEEIAVKWDKNSTRMRGFTYTASIGGPKWRNYWTVSYLGGSTESEYDYPATFRYSNFGTGLQRQFNSGEPVEFYTRTGYSVQNFSLRIDDSEGFQGSYNPFVDLGLYFYSTEKYGGFFQMSWSSSEIVNSSLGDPVSATGSIMFSLGVSAKTSWLKMPKY